MITLTALACVVAFNPPGTLDLTTRVDEAQAADRIARARYERGVLELLGVLETERRLRAAEEALINAQSNLWNARIDLHLSLGGDWLPGEDDDPQLAANEDNDNPERSGEDS